MMTIKQFCNKYGYPLEEVMDCQIDEFNETLRWLGLCLSFEKKSLKVKRL